MAAASCLLGVDRDSKATTFVQTDTRRTISLPAASSELPPLPAVAQLGRSAKKRCQSQKTMSKDDPSFFGGFRRIGMTLSQRLVMWAILFIGAPLVQTIWEGGADWWAHLHDILTPTGSKLALVLTILCVGGVLYTLREYNGVVYGSLELMFAAGSGLFAAGRLTGPAGRVDFIMAVCAATYIAVRGFDNISKGLKRIREMEAGSPQK